MCDDVDDGCSGIFRCSPISKFSGCWPLPCRRGEPTLSHRVFTCVSVSCLHSFSCSIHWSKSLSVALSSILVPFSVLLSCNFHSTVADSGAANPEMFRKEFLLDSRETHTHRRHDADTPVSWSIPNPGGGGGSDERTEKPSPSATEK